MNDLHPRGSLPQPAQPLQGEGAKAFYIAPPSDFRPGIALIALTGILADTAWAQLAQAVAALKAPVRLLDFSGVTGSDASLEEAGAFGRRLARETGPSRPHYLMVVSGDLLFSLCHMVQMTLDRACLSAGVFRSLPAALSWLEEERRMTSLPWP